MALSKRRILVVGANGYIGSNLAQQLLNDGEDVKLTDLAEESILNYDNYFQIDFSDSNGLKELIENIDFIYFFAGRTGNSTEGFNQADEFIVGNEVTLVNLLNIIKEQEHKPKIIFPSTRLLYKGSDQLINEKSELEPKSVYSINKLACENYLKIYGDCFGIESTVFRISLPYGSLVDQQRVSYGVMSFLVNRAQQGEELFVYGEGTQKGSLIHISDLVEILILGGLNEKATGETYNVGGPDHMAMGKVVELIANKYTVPVSKVDWPEISRRTDQGDLVFDSSKILQLTNYAYKQRFLTWLDQTKP